MPLDPEVIRQRIAQRKSQVALPSPHLPVPKKQVDGEAEFKDMLNKPMLLHAVIRIGEKDYDGKDHAEALNKALKAGEKISHISRRRDGMFKTSDGRTISRKDAKKEFGIAAAELIPTQYGKKSLPFTPTPKPAKD